MRKTNQILKIALIISFQLLIVNSYAQEDSLTVHKIKGKDYYIHTVETGNTLYFLSKFYDTPVDVIKKENPSVNDGLSIGEKIFIPLKREADVEAVNNGNYLTHEVEKGRTLYSLAKEYNVLQNDIIALNPEIVDNGIKEGQIIKIPVKQIKQEQLSKADKKPNYKTHTVRAKETLYSLSKHYKVSIDSIKIVNNGLLNGLKEGEKIYLPIIETQREVANTIYTNTLTSTQIIDSLNLTLISSDSIIKKAKYNIALLLPFYIEENEEVVTNAIQQKEIYPKSRFAIEFYHGVITGLEALSNDDVKFELYAYDTNGIDSIATQNALKKIDEHDIDLIIGPLYYSNFEVAASYALANKIPIISPVKQNNKILLGNQFVFKAIPSKSSIVKHYAKLAVDSFSTSNLLALSHINSKEKPLVDSFIKEYNEIMVNKRDTLIYSSIKKVELDNAQDVISSLNKTSNNVIFVPSTNSTFVTNLFSVLANTLTTKEYKTCKVTLIGLEEWQKFNNIDLEYFQSLNVYFSSSQYVNYDDKETAKIISNYYKTTETYPSNSSLLGYDIINYFATKLREKGTVFIADENDMTNSISIQFNFIKTGVESGFENTHTNVLKHEDYTLKKIN